MMCTRETAGDEREGTHRLCTPRDSQVCPAEHTTDRTRHPAQIATRDSRGRRLQNREKDFGRHTYSDRHLWDAGAVSEGEITSERGKGTLPAIRPDGMGAAWVGIDERGREREYSTVAEKHTTLTHYLRWLRPRRLSPCSDILNLPPAYNEFAHRVGRQLQTATSVELSSHSGPRDMTFVALPCLPNAGSTSSGDP